MLAIALGLPDRGTLCVVPVYVTMFQGEKPTAKTTSPKRNCLDT